LKKLIIILLIGILISCDKSNLKEIKFEFYPSFHTPTRFTINVQNKTIEQYVYQDSYEIEEKIDSNSSWVTQKDTLIVHYKKTFKIDNSSLDKFLLDLNLSKLDSTVEHRQNVLDGIGFRVSKINNKNDTISLTSISPFRTEKFKMDYKILDAFFKMAYKTVDDNDGIVTLENIQDYFHYGLPIRKVSENPIEYRVWGSIYGCREDNQEFLKVLQNLPNDKPVIFDLRNGSISYCLNEVLEEISQKKEIYLYGNRAMLESKEIMEDIKLAEKNGEKLSELRLQAYETHKKIYENWGNNEKVKSFSTKKEVLITIANNVHKK
jgi:hypothetical protein